ncbi:hypothetical protein FRC04_001464 [Tulasnella sp. 424]|nr:hypothetical protein FRC04_001464 [Tulasnella sp. 424]KAG8974522.1 hypothetical protein FRC05_007154 [Tulasnella sp. 425]
MATTSHDRYIRDDYADDELTGDEMGVREFSDESRCSSPTWSIYSYESSVDHQRMLREIHGRVFNNTSEFYMLPADAPEHCRLDMQHEMLKKKMNGLWLRPDAVHRALAPKQTEVPSILDVGAGSGCWVLDVAKLFPHADVVGIDLAPANLNSPPPPNCRFECDDVNLGLEQYYGSFDVVNARCVSSGIADYRAFLEDVGQVLRPGGVFQSIECDLQLYDDQFRPITARTEDDPGFSWTQKIALASLCAMEARGPGIRAGPQIPKWLREMEGVWEETGEKVLWIPIGPWGEDSLGERSRYVAELMRQDALRFTSSVRPLLLTAGYFEETLDLWTERVHDELRHLRKRMYIRWICAWGIKRRKPGDDVFY